MCRIYHRLSLDEHDRVWTIFECVGATVKGVKRRKIAQEGKRYIFKVKFHIFAMPRTNKDIDYSGFAPVLLEFPVIWDSSHTEYKLVDSTRRAYRKIEKRLRMERKIFSFKVRPQLMKP